MNETEEIFLANLILPLIKDFVIPKVTTVFKKYPSTNLENKKIIEDFDLYLTQRYEKFLIIDTLVFPNKQTLLKILYQPLTLSSKESISGDNIEIKINGYPDNLIPEFMRVIIEDTAGMGKSTITKKLFQSVIENKAGIPILVELSQINSKNSILKEIQNQISPIGKKINQDFIIQLINEGNFIFLFDGFDEIALKDREYAIRDLQKFIEKCSDNQFLITSRPEDSLVSFGDFKKFKVNPLDKGEAYSLLNKYDTYSYHKIAKSLIKQLNDNPTDSLQEYLTNPFLVSLLYKSYEYKKDIPVKKSQFYQQVFDALFETHDLSKEGYLKRDKYSNLHVDDFERVLRYLAYFTSIENKVEYDKNSIIQFITKSKNYLTDLNFSSSDFLKDLIKTVPVFKKEGSYYKWGHKSLQDYFAAKFIWIDSKENQVDILLKIYNDARIKRFYNILNIYHELDPKGFDNVILKMILNEFKEFSNSNYTYLDKTDKIVKTRVENSFNKKVSIAISKAEEFKLIQTGGRDRKSREIFDYYEKKVGYFEGHTTFNYFEYPEVVALSFIKINSSKDTIIELISNIYPEIAEHRLHKIELKKLKTLEQGSVYVLDDNENNILNQKNVFGLVNDLIRSDYSFNYDNAMRKLNEIDNDALINVKNDLLNW